MTSLCNLLTDISSKLRADPVLKGRLSNVYEQVTIDAVIPYLYLHLANVALIHTFDRSAHSIKIECHLFSNSLNESVLISDKVQLLCGNFFSDDKKYLLSNISYKITYSVKSLFQSVTNLEVITDDYSEISR